MYPFWLADADLWPGLSQPNPASGSLGSSISAPVGPVIKTSSPGVMSQMWLEHTSGDDAELHTTKKKEREREREKKMRMCGVYSLVL